MLEVARIVVEEEPHIAVVGVHRTLAEEEVHRTVVAGAHRILEELENHIAGELENRIAVEEELRIAAVGELHTVLEVAHHMIVVGIDSAGARHIVAVVAGIDQGEELRIVVAEEGIVDTEVEGSLQSCQLVLPSVGNAHTSLRGSTITTTIWLLISHSRSKYLFNLRM
jgi:hypothetical protein